MNPFLAARLNSPKSNRAQPSSEPAVRLSRPPDAATPITTAQGKIDQDSGQKANRRLNQGIDVLLARQVLVKTHPRDPDDDACADDDEHQVRRVRDVRPDEDPEHRIEHQDGEEAAPM